MMERWICNKISFLMQFESPISENRKNHNLWKYLSSFVVKHQTMYLNKYCKPFSLEFKTYLSGHSTAFGLKAKALAIWPKKGQKKFKRHFISLDLTIFQKSTLFFHTVSTTANGWSNYKHITNVGRLRFTPKNIAKSVHAQV